MARRRVSPPLPDPLPDASARAGLDAAPDGILAAREDGTLRYGNPAMGRLLGVAPGALPGTSLRAWVPDDWWVDWQNPVLETVLPLADGTRVPVVVTRAWVPGDGRRDLFLYVHDLTARRATEAALRRSEHRYALAFNASPDAINLTRLKDGTYLEVSEGFTRMSGWTRDESLGRTAIELGIWAEPDERRSMAALLRERGEFDGLAFSFRHKTGRLLKGLMSGRIVSLDGVPCILTITRDITRQVEAEQALRNLSELMTSIMTQVQAYIALIDRRGRIRFLNRVPAGIAPEDIQGADFRLGLREETRELADRALAAVLAGSPQEAWEGWAMGPGGKWCWYHSQMGPMTENGELTGAVLVSLDETLRRRQEERIRDSEDRFQAFQLHTPDALFWIRVETGGRLAMEGMNPAAERVLGLASEQVRGRSFEAVVPASMARLFEDHVRQTLAAGAPRTFEEDIPGQAGTVHMTTTLVPVRDAAGRIYRVVGTSRDTTHARRMEEALRQAQKLESLGVLAGGIAHDFNNLLTAIMGNLNLAQAGLPETSPALPLLDAVENAVLKASELTGQMLAYSGKGRFSVKPRDLNAVVSDLVRLLKATLTKKATLQVQLGEDLPAIEGDAAQLQQVVMNLVTNASDALGGREGVIRIATSLASLDAARIAEEFPAQNLSPGPYVVLEVEDTGCGMTPEVLARIFDPFFTTKIQGRGLGLSAMLGILRGHKAGLRIRSEPGSGSLFQVYFPATAGKVPAEAEARPEAGCAFRGRVLLVDDEEIILESTGAVLASLGFEVVAARDGQEALEAFSAPGADWALVLMDLTMPRMDGATAFRAMRDLKPGVPVILSSGYDRQALEGAQPAAFVQKPYRVKELGALVRDVLAGTGAPIPQKR
ncbi:hybrid sensor histidine kinase/response regulator [Mesoterricola sediminis]|uniref:histidine kinase n=1 Tax=Mesoterricola sediminis TaxID=2927980 RepID=A0AA48KD21_9BACT|nr:PAS domain S-box protein [Mesoterricola sediminis]BDU76625.1 hypothetical protein METESE_15830 [Mesoterricola sediminis]